MAEVILDQVTKVYPGGVRAVHEVNLTINDQEFVVLVGPSGCGKSTTLRMIAGLEEITKGTVSIGRTREGSPRIVNDVPPKDRDIAMVFQNYALYPHMTVYKNMAFGLKLRKFPRLEIDRRVREAAQILGIHDLLDRKPKALSGGQRQRVAVGRAIVRKPAAFLFDEPLSNLDAKLRVEMRVELNKLHTRLQTTMIYVTHDQIEAMTLGERIVIMHDGVLQQVAEPMRLYDFPANEFVASFIGTPPMNFLEGRIAGEGESLHFTDEAEVKIAVPAPMRPSVAPYRGKRVKLGVRPENVHDREFSALPPEGSTLEAMVDVVEALGAEQLVYLRVKGRQTPLVSKIGAHQRITSGMEMTAVLDLHKIHLFDRETGVNLTAPKTEGTPSEMATAGK